VPSKTGSEIVSCLKIVSLALEILYQVTDYISFDSDIISL
jgi:hypothetical protein